MGPENHKDRINQLCLFLALADKGFWKTQIKSLGGGRYPHLLESTSQEGVPGNPGKSHTEGQEDHGTLKQLEGVPLAVLPLPGPPGLHSGSSLGPFKLPQGIYFQEDEGVKLKIINSNIILANRRNR